jgi:hypothetical protein
MMRLEASTESDIEQIKNWIDRDEWHRGQPSDFWLTGMPGSLLAFRLDDECGPLLYCRLDAQNEFGLSRIHLQFAPDDVTNKRRVIVGMLKAMTVLFDHVRDTGAAGIIFESSSPRLISFFRRQGFVRVEDTDDYVLTFESVVPANLIN